MHCCVWFESQRIPRQYMWHFLQKKLLSLNDASDVGSLRKRRSELSHCALRTAQHKTIILFSVFTALPFRLSSNLIIIRTWQTILIWRNLELINRPAQNNTAFFYKAGIKWREVEKRCRLFRNAGLQVTYWFLLTSGHSAGLQEEDEEEEDTETNHYLSKKENEEWRAQC